MAMTLYFSPGACSTASHIGCEETGAPYEEKLTSLAKGEQKTEAYLKINPRGKVPALAVDGHVITENTAILTYLGKRFPEKNLLPKDPIAEAHAIGAMAWFSNTLHPAFTHVFRPERFVEGEESQKSVKALGRKSFYAALEDVDRLLNGNQWMMGSQYTVVDAYALVFYGWGTRVELPMANLRNYTAWKDRMLARPQVRKILESEQNILVAKK